MAKNTKNSGKNVAKKVFDLEKAVKNVFESPNITEKYDVLVASVNLVNESAEAAKKIDFARTNYEKEKTPELYQKLSDFMECAKKLKPRTDTMRENLKSLNSDVEKTLYSEIRSTSDNQMFDLLKVGFIDQYKIENEDGVSSVALSAFKTVDPAAYEKQFDDTVALDSVWKSMIETVRYRITAASVGSMRAADNANEEEIDYGLPQYKLPAWVEMEDADKKSPLTSNTAIAKALQNILDKMVFVPNENNKEENAIKVYNKDAARVREVLTGYGRERLGVSYLKEKRFRDAVIECFHAAITRKDYVFEYEKVGND